MNKSFACAFLAAGFSLAEVTIASLSSSGITLMRFCPFRPRITSNATLPTAVAKIV